MVDWDVTYIRTECPGISDEEVLKKAMPFGS